VHGADLIKEQGEWSVLKERRREKEARPTCTPGTRARKHALRGSLRPADVIWQLRGVEAKEAKETIFFQGEEGKAERVTLL